MEIPDSVQGPAALSKGTDVSTAGQDDQANAQTSDSLQLAAFKTIVKSAAKGVSNTNTAYLNLGFDSLKLATVKLMDPSKRCIVTPDTPRTCLIEEIHSTKDGELSKILEYHLEIVKLNDYLPFSAMLLVAHGTTSLFQNINADGCTFASLPYELKGLKMVTHHQKPAVAGPRGTKRLRFSDTAIQDCSTESLLARGIRQLHFHHGSSKHDWQCFVDVHDSKYVSMFGSSEHSFFEHVMAATIELFERGRMLHESRPLRSDPAQHYEVIARAKYTRQVARKRIALENWSQYLACLNVQPQSVSRQHQSGLDFCRNLQKECVDSEHEQQLAVETNAHIFGGMPSAVLDVESGNEASVEEEADSDKIADDAEKGMTPSVNLCEKLYGKDIGVNLLSTNAQKKRKEKRFKQGKAQRSVRNTPGLAPRPAGNATDEDDVAGPEKSGSVVRSKQYSLVNTAENPESALHPTYIHPSRLSGRNTDVTGSTYIVLEKVADMTDSSGRGLKIARGGDAELADEDRSELNDSTGEDDSWQTVVQRKPRKSADKPSALATSFRSGGPQASMTQARNTLHGTRPQDLFLPASSPSGYPATASTVAPALNVQEFPSLPTTTQSNEAIQKVMAKKKKKKDKRKKKKKSAVQSESSQSSSTPRASSQEPGAATHSQLFANLVLQGTQESQGRSSDGTAHVTDDDITPNASMINLAAANTSQPGSLAVPASAMEIQSAVAPALSVASARQPGSTSALPSANSIPTRLTSPTPPDTPSAALLVHKFGALEGPTRIVCRMPGCENTTSPWDGSTVICPSCGPYSSIRYCCIDHLLQDTTDHWGLDCMKYTCHHLCDASTIHPRQVQCPPAIPNLCGWNTPERHRQAVYHAHSSKKNGFAEVEGDYFIFTDAEEWIQAGSPNMQARGLRRARGTVLVVVAFDDERSPDSLKDRFNRLLNIALFTGASNTLLLDHLFLMLRENLLSKSEWDGTILDSVVYQFQWEFSYHLPEWLTNNLRHACPHQWFGTPIDLCSDRTCNREQLQSGTRHPLGPRLLLKEKAEELERRYWILRVARVYHPSVQDPVQRMRGVGSGFVLAENKRQFRMGREWDGFPSGTMEIEGAIWVPNGNGPPRLHVANITTLTV